jgi:hypothetical protein
MVIPRARLTVRGLIVAVALAGFRVAAPRVHAALGVLVLSISCLSFLRVLEVAGRCRNMRKALNGVGVVRCALGSGLIAALILFSSLLLDLLIYPIANRARMHETPRIRVEHVACICIGSLMGIPIDSALGRRL